MTPNDTKNLNLAAILLLGGAHVLVISVFADELAFGSSEKFGWQQYGGMVLAGILLLTGAVIRTPVLMAIGLAIGLFTAAADWLAFGSNAGFGWQQIAGTAVGFLLMAGGWLSYRLRARRHHSPDEPPTTRS